MEIMQDRVKLSVTKEEYQYYYDNWNTMVDGFGYKWIVTQIDHSGDIYSPKYSVTLDKLHI